MSRLLDLLHSGRVLLMDGAMGTELQRAGLTDGTRPETLNLTHPDRVQAIHQAYVEAGARVLLTNTFQAHVAQGLLDQRAEIQESALRLARAAVGAEGFVLADVGPLPAEMGDPASLDAILPNLGAVDGLLLETSSDPLVFNVAQHCRVASWCDGVPVLVSIAYERNEEGKICSHSRHPPEWFAMLARQYRVEALGVNCGKDIGLDEVIEIVRRYRKVSDLPLFARPNAGTPTRDAERWLYPLTPQSLADRLPELLEAGAGMVGGCCGTTPEHIAALRPIVERSNATRQK